jgi:hypothetical protein
MHTNGEAQSPSAVQVVRHAPVPQVYGLQPTVPTVWHVPLPLHVRAGVSVTVDAGQLAATQIVPVAYCRHAPAPLQKPSVPHVDAPASVHWFSGSWPAPTFAHVPSVPASAHDRQVAVHAVAQHTPCAQMPLAQSVAAAQLWPFGRLTHTPPEHTLGARQSPSTVHVTRHALPLHTYGSQDEDVAVRQVPIPLQVRAGVNVDALQVAATHTVPAACSRQAPAPLQNPSWAHVLAAAAAH